MAAAVSPGARVLVTGGAGFIGSHLVDALLACGHRVVVLDSLDPQAHEGGVARHLDPEAELIKGDLRNRDDVSHALAGVEVVFHQGGMVGNGQSMYEMARYIDVNGVGTAILLEEVVERRDRVRRVIGASSMVVYGDGSYRCDRHGAVAPPARREQDLAARVWEPRCPRCERFVTPAATGEDQPLRSTSPYAISKRDCEELMLTAGRAYGVEVVALRYLNVYGPRQALGNPYTGVAALFCTRLLSGRRPVIFEDGNQRRDLIHVDDVVRANLLAMDAEEAPGNPINIGTGTSITVAELARTVAHELGVDLEPEVTGRYRAGDIRHCWADVSRAQRLLGFTAEADRGQALYDLASWVARESPVDRTEAANAELAARGLIR